MYLIIVSVSLNLNVISRLFFFWKQLFIKPSPLPTAQSNNLIPELSIFLTQTLMNVSKTTHTLPTCPLKFHPPTPSHLSQTCPLVHKTPPFHLLIYQSGVHSKIWLTFITLSLYLSTPITFSINQLTTYTNTLFCSTYPIPK